MANIECCVYLPAFWSSLLQKAGKWFLDPTNFQPISRNFHDFSLKFDHFDHFSSENQGIAPKSW